MLSIGEFSARCGLSVKVLRSYGDAGVLVPAAVDAATGYRYYSPDQLPAAALIGTLRRAGVPVAEIAAFLAAPDTARFDRWSAAMARESVRRRRALAEAQILWNGGAPMTLHRTSGAASDVGGRDANEDALLRRHGLFAVADGIGGLPGGADASRRALEALDAAFAADPTLSGLVAAVHEANRSVGEGGTTLTALGWTADAGAAVVHVGDSRLYRLRSGRLALLTRDHSLVADLVDAGEITAEEAAVHEQRYVLTRAVGVHADLDVDYAGVSCTAGDRFLLCTDGLHQTVGAERVRELLEGEPEDAARALVAAALASGATDNVTAVVVAV